MSTTTTQNRGLEDIIAGVSSICYIDGENGILAYRGIDIHELADYATFEEVTYLLWHGKLPTRSELPQIATLVFTDRDDCGRLRQNPKRAAAD